MVAHPVVAAERTKVLPKLELSLMSPSPVAFQHRYAAAVLITLRHVLNQNGYGCGTAERRRSRKVEEQKGGAEKREDEVLKRILIKNLWFCDPSPDAGLGKAVEIEGIGK